MSPRLILFAGAPLASSLGWHEQDLLTTFSESIARFAQLDDGSDVSRKRRKITPTHPSWRSLPLERQHLPTGVSQDCGWEPEYAGAEFFSTSHVLSCGEDLSPGSSIRETPSASVESVEQVLSQFYDVSYAAHQNILSSQLAAISDVGTSFTTDSTSFNTTASIRTSLGDSRGIPVAGRLTNLKDMPSAAHISTIQPQTMTFNLIVGIISIPAPRAIRTRRGDDVELVELLVGDETKSGFGINFWLASSRNNGSELRTILEMLRPQDVVLIRNVALSSFRGKVYGQSLRKEMTNVHLLFRNRIDRSDRRGCYAISDLSSEELQSPQVEKTVKVREWVMRFVGVGNTHVKRNMEEPHRENLPPDTQSQV